MSAASIEEAVESVGVIFFDPGIHLLIADAVGAGGKLVISVVGKTMADDVDAFVEGGLAPGDGLFLARIGARGRGGRKIAAAILTDPVAQLGAGADVVLEADVALGSLTGLILLDGLTFELWRIGVIGY